VITLSGFYYSSGYFEFFGNFGKKCLNFWSIDASAAFFSDTFSRMLDAVDRKNCCTFKKCIYFSFNPEVNPTKPHFYSLSQRFPTWNIQGFRGEVLWVPGVSTNYWSISSSKQKRLKKYPLFNPCYYFCNV